MLVPSKHRKTIHIVLFVFVIFIQLLIFFLWYNQHNDESELNSALHNSKKQNTAFIFSNEATKNYFDAENHFVEYLHNYNPNSLNNYRNSLDKMAIYLDSLNQLIREDKHFALAINGKKGKEQEIIKLRRELEYLLKNSFAPLSEKSPGNFEMTPYNYKKVLQSIKYDSIRISDAVIKKNMLSRISDAIIGKYDFKREELQIYMKMLYGDAKRSGTIEDQMKNIFLSTGNYYNNEFSHLKNTYSSLRERDQEVMLINKKILANSQDILLFYTQSAQESSQIQFDNAMANIKNKKSLIIILILVMAICTILLLIYSIFAYLYEKDLSEAKKETEHNLEFKNRLLGMLSHEMRAPLNIISNLTHKLKNTNSDTNLNAPVNLLHFTSNSLQITVNQILDFFKNESTDLVVYNSKVNLKVEITAILESLRSLTNVKKIKLITNIDPEMENEIMVDSGKIHQLFYNIIGNAIKFTNKGSITVDCGFTTIGDQYRFEVNIKDTGVGIPAEDLSKIFDKFYQSKYYKEQISFGAGLGLNLCKEIVTLYHGEINATSQLQKGTEITFHLYLEKAASVQSNQMKLMERLKDMPIRAAIVDDDSIALSILKKTLNDVNVLVADFNSAAALSEYLQNNTVDLIVTDLQIGTISGVDFIRKVKKSNTENANAKMIAITGDVSMNTINLESIDSDEIIIKPINKEEFYSKILKVLQ